MLCEYRLTLDDYKAAQRLHIQCNQRVRFWFFFWHRFMPVVSSAALVLLLWDVFYRHFALPAWVGGVLAGLSFAGFYVPAIRPFLVRRAFRTLMEDASGGHGLLQLELRESELISRIPGRSEGRFQSVAIYEMVRDERICLIYIRKKLFLFVPRESMPEELWAALADWSGKAKSCGANV